MRFYSKEAVQAFELGRLKYLQTALNGHVFTITLARPEKRNAFTPTMAEEIAFALAYAHYTPAVRCVVLAAEGPVFCAGADLNAFRDAAADLKNPDLPLPQVPITLGDAFIDLQKPCIAQVEGPVLAGGFLLLAGCTLVVSTPEATFGLPEVKRGLWPMQVMASLLRILPPRRVLELCLTGRSFSAQEALAMGLVTGLSAPDQIGQEVQTLAKQISENAPLAIRVGMETFNALFEVPPTQQHAYLKAQLDRLVQSEDAREGIAAFREKRPPRWEGK
ncbi:enoyl-CoA hydratase [Rhabdobacter roseus]|uniref:Enoyl-CoA hydratase/carnithine racemase n=1 Tax=Rhabdobacter roseus TaxID=1655419 RepID=A0A840TSF6_9BACT|nr:enoyl-CoA hydratase-related protein [Rhabdobacter roseus]MBB5284502.1 enoyl-CoA hydratase/carnithine racemase [Rhabdobacter roseus]